MGCDRPRRTRYGHQLERQRLQRRLAPHRLAHDLEQSAHARCLRADGTDQSPRGRLRLEVQDDVLGLDTPIDEDQLATQGEHIVRRLRAQQLHQTKPDVVRVGHTPTRGTLRLHLERTPGGESKQHARTAVSRRGSITHPLVCSWSAGGLRLSASVCRHAPDPLNAAASGDGEVSVELRLGELLVQSLERRQVKERRRHAGSEVRDDARRRWRDHAIR